MQVKENTKERIFFYQERTPSSHFKGDVNYHLSVGIKQRFLLLMWEDKWHLRRSMGKWKEFLSIGKVEGNPALYRKSAGNALFC